MMPLPGLDDRMTLSEASLALGVHPFELIRVLVALGAFPPDLHLNAEEVERVRTLGGLERWWEPDSQGEAVRRSDPIAARGIARGLCVQLIEHGLLDPTSARLDNIFRGLDADTQAVVRAVLHALVQEGYLRTFNTPSGVNVTIASQHGENVLKIASGDAFPRALALLWQR
jgi:hypothetical protein